MDPRSFGYRGRPQWRRVPGPRPGYPPMMPVPVPMPMHGPRPSHHSRPNPPVPGDPAAVEALEGIEVGAKCEIKQVYGTPNPVCECCTVWENELPNPDDAGDGVKARQERDGYAVVRRQVRHGPRMAWETHSIDVNSRLIKKKLETLFSTYMSVDVSEPYLSFKVPFVPFVHQWDALQRLEEEESDEETKKHLQLLIEVLEPEITASFDILERLEKSGYVGFDSLELAFVPGETILFSEDGVLSAGVLREVDLVEVPMCPHFFQFKADIIDSDGKKMGVASEIWKQQKYKGRRHISSLDVFPLRFHPKQHEIELALLERGKAFEKLQGQYLKFYSGKARCAIEEGRDPYHMQEETEKVRPLNERIIVDTESWSVLKGECDPELRPLATLGKADNFDQEKEESEKDYCFVDHNIATPPLTDRECIFAPPYVKGFALKSKVWARFNVNEIHHVDWVPDALDKLVLDAEEKSLLLGLISSREEDGIAFDDFIPNKGKGIVVLLSGPPGVGKTLTAEAVAEKLERPLYRLDAVDIGTHVSSVERHLQEALERCSHWKAVLLIDEAEVFLETRSKYDLARNELVSTFLRMLEYYEGIMILTTNRISVIDPAFESRIDINLAYSDLDQASRAQVWRGFLASLGPHSVEIDDAEIEVLSESALNGRQIKSAVKTACILAAREKSPLKMHHLQVVLLVREKSARMITGDADDLGMPGLAI